MRVLMAPALVLLASCSRESKPASVCEIGADPSRFEGHRVTVVGEARMLRHLSVIEDPVCPDSPLPIVGGEGNKATDQFWSALAGTLAPKRPPVRANLTGRIERQSDLPAYVLRVEEAE
jgi:hypothetical protein